MMGLNQQDKQACGGHYSSAQRGNCGMGERSASTVALCGFHFV